MDDTSPSSSPTPPPRSALRGFAIAATCTAAMVVNNANNTSVAIALPSIGMDLRAHATTLQWLVSAYALSSGCLLVFFGHIADVHGRKRVFLGGSVVLAAFTLGCGFAQSQNAMIVLRTLQGVGGAATIPAAIGILAHNFPPSAGRAHAIAFASLAAGGPLGAALGMVLGGLLTQLTSDTWRAQFFLTAGLTVLTLVAGMLFFPNDAPPSFSPTAAPPPSTPRPSAAPTDDGTGKTAGYSNTYPPPPSPTPTPLVEQSTRHKTDWLGVFLSTTGLVLLVFSLGQGAGPGPPPPMRAGPPPPPPGGGWAELGMRADVVCGKGGRSWPGTARRRKGKGKRDEMWAAQVVLGEPAEAEDGEEEAVEEVELVFDDGLEEDIEPHHPHGRPHSRPPPPPPRFDLMRWLFVAPPPRHPPPPPPRPPPFGYHRRPIPESDLTSHETDFVEMLDSGTGTEDVTGTVDTLYEGEVDFERFQRHCPERSRPGRHRHGHPPPPPPPLLRWLFGHPHPHPHPRQEDGSWDWPPPGPPGGEWKGSGDAWGMPYIIALLALSIVLLGMFALWEMYLSRPRSSRTKNSFLAWAEAPPLLPPALFARGRGRVGAMYLVALLQFGAFMTWAFWVQLYYQIYIGLTPVGTVVKLIPMFVTGILCNLLVAIIAGRIPTGWLLTAGTLTTTIAPLLFTLIIPSASYWAFGFPAAVCVVVGVDFLFSAGMMFVASSVEPGEQSVAGGMFQTMTQLGTSFGVTASTIVFNHVQQWDANGGEGALKSYHAAMWTGVAFGGLAAIVAFVAFWGVRVQPPGPPPSVGPTPAHHENLVAESRSRSGDEGRDSDSRVAQALEKSKRRGDGEQV